MMCSIKGVRGERVDNILSKMGEYYGVSKESLTTCHVGRKGDVWKWKKNLVFVLYQHTDLSVDEIQKVLGYKQYGTVNYHIKAMQEELSDEKYGIDRAKKTYNEIIKFLGL
jgi:chromosomal replication initiation ATPase DnaA